MPTRLGARTVPRSPDAATYLDGLRTSDAPAPMRIDDAPSSRGPTWRGPAARPRSGRRRRDRHRRGRSRQPRRRTERHGRGGDRIGLGGFAADARDFLDLDTGERTALTSVEEQNAYDFQPSPDGTRMLFYQGNALSIANADGSGVDCHRRPGRSRMASWAWWSPDRHA